MKKIFAVSLFLFLFLPLFSEITEWKGMELGKDENPSWFSEYVFNKKEKKIRQKFSLKKKDVIFYGYAESLDRETALYESEMEALKKIDAYAASKAKKNEETVRELKGAKKVTDFWQKDENEVFHYYSFYVLR